MQLTKKHHKGKTTKEVVATAQDIKYARFLAGNDKVIRDKAIKSLKKWFEQRCRSQIPFSDSDLMLVWKGLFYSMWMSDKPLIQEECADRIASLIHSLDTSTGFLFFKAGMKTLANEWFGIDQWRSDKFQMFVRRLLRQAFVLLRNNNFELKLIKLFASSLDESILNSERSVPLSLMMHFCDIYMPELAKMSEGQLNPNIMNEFLQPFVKALSNCNDIRIVNAISDGVFRYLMKQSNAAMEHEEKFEAWKKLGFPGGNIDAMQRAGSDEEDADSNMESNDDDDNDDEDDSGKDEDDHDDESEEEELTGLDPRAGRVNVVLPQLSFSCKNINSLMNEYKFKASNTKARSAIKKLIHEFSMLSGGEYPLGIKKVDLYEDDGSTNIKKMANKLVKFENQLYGRNKAKKAKKRNITDCDGDDDDLGDQEVPVMKKPKLDKQSINQTLQVKKQKKNEKIKKSTLTEKVSKKSLNGIGTQTTDSKQSFKSSGIRGALDGSSKLQEAKMKLKVAMRERKLLKQSIKQKKAAIKRSESHEAHQKQLESDDLFVRNSGTWFVTEPESESDYELDSPQKTNGMMTNGTSPKNTEVSPKRRNSFVESSPKKSPKSPKPETAISTQSSTKQKMTSTPLKISPPTANKLFVASDWDTDLQDGEVELFVPSKKYIAKRKSMGAPADLVDKSFSIIKGKDRRKSADAQIMLRNSSVNTPKSNKKVKIDLRLNQSQEVHEHHAQIKSSPGIPFDASKKPTKPVIKANAMPSPINPFYNRRRMGLQF